MIIIYTDFVFVDQILQKIIVVVVIIIARNLIISSFKSRLYTLITQNTYTMLIDIAGNENKRSK